MMKLGEAAHLWLGEPDLSDVRLRKFECELLSSEERQRAARFTLERDRRLYLFAHSLLRVTLARYLDVLPSSLRFVVSSRGRPELACSGTLPPIRFNLTHTDGLVACVITRRADCGVDAECVDHHVDFDQLTPSVLTSTEAERVAEMPPERRGERFIQIWTLKEAYVKARGLGLALPLTEIEIVRFGREPRCRLSTGFGDEGDNWQFWSGRPTTRHRYAVAVRGCALGRLDVFEASPDLHTFRSRLPT